MNTLASEAIGRRYLLQVDQGKPEIQGELVSTLVLMIKQEKTDTQMR